MTSGLQLIPTHELDDYSRLTTAAQDEFALWSDCIRELMCATRATIGDVTARHAAIIGCSVAQVRRKWTEWNNGAGQYAASDWRILVNKRIAGAAWWDTDRAPLPEQFLDYWHGLAGQNQRGKRLTQWRALIRQWKRWQADGGREHSAHAIPGYKTCPPPNPSNGNWPSGWSYRNLMHIQRRPRNAEMALHTIGTAAALRELPPVPGTRVGARFLEWVFFDDVWCDRKVIVPGYRSAVRLLQLGGLDYATGVYLHFGQRPELPADDGTRERLKERDTKYLIASILERYGYPRDYIMHFVLERGTATVRPADARALYDLSGGRIICCYTTMEGSLVVAWDERSSGNSRGKAPLESWHNLFHNESACEPGQIGKDRDHSPAEIAGRDREAQYLHDAAMLMPATAVSNLRLPYPTAEAAYWKTQEIVDRINARTDHDLEGFEKDVLQWRITGVQMDWQPAAALENHPLLKQLAGRVATPLATASPLDRDLALNLDHHQSNNPPIQHSPPSLDDLIEWLPRCESPLERMARLSAAVTLEKLPPGVLCRFYEDTHVLAKIKHFAFEFKRDGKLYRFLPADIDSAPPEGTELCGYYQWPHAEHIHLTRNGAYVGTWKRDTRIARGDTAALAERIRQKTAQLNTVMANVRRQRHDEIEAREAELQHNLKAIEDAGIVPSNGVCLHNKARVETHCGPTAKQLQAAAEEVKREHARDRDRARTKQDLAALAEEALLANAKPSLPDPDYD